MSSVRISLAPMCRAAFETYERRLTGQKRKSGGSIRDSIFLTVMWIARRAPRGSWMTRTLVLPFRVISIERSLYGRSAARAASSVTLVNPKISASFARDCTAYSRDWGSG